MPKDLDNAQDLRGAAITALADPQLKKTDRVRLYSDFIGGLQRYTLELLHVKVLNKPASCMALASFGKADWIGRNHVDGDKLSADCYHIHFESALDLLNPIKRDGNFSIGFALHYETTPYVPQTRRENMPGYTAYLHKRHVVKEKIHQLLDQIDVNACNVTIKKRHSKNAILQISFHHVQTFDDLEFLFECSLLKLVPLVDQALEEVRK